MLIMSPHENYTLQALVAERWKTKTSTDDIIQDKGQCLVLLLSGPPGTGMTLTAESVASRLRLPLYALEASQLGRDHAGIEAALSRMLRPASEREVVLLFDETDAFLEKRSSNVDSEAVNHNKRVAGPIQIERFLRVLEYHRGVLVLTTNRYIEFDDAFLSRIHLTVRHPTLIQASRKTIWRNFLLPLTVIEEDQLDVLVEHSLNGMQMKNAVEMARLLVKNEETPLTSSPLSDIVSVMTEDSIE